MKSKAPSYQDIRSQTERDLAESQAQFFKQKMAEPDWGYQSQTAAHDPIWKRYQKQFSEQLSGAAAERGFGALRQGPTQELEARGAQEMAETRASQEASEMDAYKRWITSSGRDISAPRGYMEQGRPSAFSQIAGPVLTGVGGALGGPLGAGIGMGLGSMFGGGQQAYTGMSDEARSRRPENEGFSGGFGRGWRGYYDRGYR